MVRKRNTAENHNMATAIITVPKIIRVPIGVSGERTMVKRPRKYKVAFGFKRFVKNPILMA